MGPLPNGLFMAYKLGLPSVKLTWHLKTTPWKRRFPLETIISRGELLVSGRVLTTYDTWDDPPGNIDSKKAISTKCHRN